LYNSGMAFHRSGLRDNELENDSLPEEDVIILSILDRDVLQLNVSAPPNSSTRQATLDDSTFMELPDTQLGLIQEHKGRYPRHNEFMQEYSGSELKDDPGEISTGIGLEDNNTKFDHSFSPQRGCTSTPALSLGLVDYSDTESDDHSISNIGLSVNDTNESLSKDKESSDSDYSVNEGMPKGKRKKRADTDGWSRANEKKTQSQRISLQRLQKEQHFWEKPSFRGQKG
jgi:hypothetical protein